MTEDRTEEKKPRHVTVTIRREMRVGWFAVQQLLATVAKVITSTIVGSMAGRRELLAALDQRPATAAPVEHDFSGREEMWLDYIADTGDGFDAALSIAWLAGRQALFLDPGGKPTDQPIPATNPEDRLTLGGPEEMLPAGELLVLGGDQVYPTASGEAYQGRLIDPFQSGLFYQTGGRKVFAMPGNHDWYDGLNGFVALFCQGGARWIGGWQTQQKRSYFSLKLPHGWWLWAVDMALEDDLDPPQLQYFERQAKLLQPGDRVILCVPSPTWIKREGHRAAIEKGAVGDREVEREIERYNLITKMVTKTKAMIRIRLSGDLHHYTRHASEIRDYIVCGGGGAFALGTGRTPEILTEATQAATLKMRFPSKAESDARRWSALWFAKLSPGFTAGLTAMHLLLCYAFYLGSRPSPCCVGADRGWVEMLRETQAGFAGFGTIATYLLGFLGDAPTAMILLAVTLLGFLGFAHSGRPETQRSSIAMLCGGLHWLLQMLVGIAAAVIAAKISALAGSWVVPVFVLLDAGLLFLFSGLVFGLYLIATNLVFGLHEQEVFSCQSIEDYKCFLRIHIQKEALTIYPIGLDTVSKSWKPAPGVVVQASKTGADLSLTEKVKLSSHCSRIYDPVEPLRPRLIEQPIRIGHG